MTSLPMPASLLDPPLLAVPDAALAVHPSAPTPALAKADRGNSGGENASVGNSVLSVSNESASNESVSNEDEQFLLRAFRSFSAAAESLERSYTRLRAEVEGLRRELEDTQGKLRREQALAEMSAMLAHEIRNPLGSLELFAGLLAETELAAEPRRWVEQMQGGLRSLAAIATNVLHSYSPPEPVRVPVDLGELLEWAGDFFAPLMRQASITLSLQNRLGGVRFSADRHALEQVLQNLVLNAVRAMPGGGWIEIRGHTMENGHEVSISVIDTGPGISPEKLPKIFDPGFTTCTGSSGLGLAVCHNIVSQHGGTIVAASRAGGGASFTLTFSLDHRSPGSSNHGADQGVAA